MRLTVQKVRGSIAYRVRSLAQDVKSSLAEKTEGLRERAGAIIKTHFFGGDVRTRTLRRGFVKAIMSGLLWALRIKVLFNVVPGLGHNTVELDLYFRMQALGLVPRDAKVILAREANAIHLDTLSIYRNRFWFATSNRIIMALIIPPAASCPDLHIDCGLSRLKWNYDAKRPLAVPYGGQTYLHQISKEENRAAWKRYFELRARTSNLFPLKEGIGLDVDLRQFLGDLSRPIAAVHIKNHVANATAAITDPSTYVPAIRYLQESGYLVVQVGREPIPKIFEELGVLDYAGSSLATYRHDLQLFAVASIAITAGSGIAMLADCMGTPLVYLDSWHIGMPVASMRSITIPALVVDKSTMRLLTFREQSELYFSLEDRGEEMFPVDRYGARNAEGDEVLAAVKELEALNGHEIGLSSLQQRFRVMDVDGLAGLSGTRIGEFFIQRHANLLD